ncbi:MAG: flagellar basal body L-ring protein FlgH [Comamonas sp.]
MNQRIRHSALVLAMVALLSGCETLQPAPVLDDAPLPFAQQPAQRASGGGLFVAHSSSGLLADQRAHREGDVLTVLLEEVTQASKRANTQTNKSSGISISPAKIAGKNFEVNAEMEAGRSFSGGGSSTQQNALSGSMTVIVHQVLPNGLLLIKGDRSLSLNQGDEILRLSGYVRASDVDQSNRVSSLRVANARISYSGRGALSEANSAGWLTRFFQSPLFPF